MPLYEYKCEKCGKKFDALQKFSDAPLTVHEECGGPVERLISPPAFHFKGSGWYVTDYAKSNGHSAPSSDTSKDSKESKTESKGETKTESTPAASSSSTETK